MTSIGKENRNSQCLSYKEQREREKQTDRQTDRQRDRDREKLELENFILQGL